jgi:anti-anti-sigma factor
MGFSSVLEIDEKGIAKITLTGELDASVSGQFRGDIEKAAAAKVKRLVLIMKDLEFMASAGLRVLVIAKQKMGANADVYIISPQESVMETFELTRFNQSVIILDKYDAAQIENI